MRSLAYGVGREGAEGFEDGFREVGAGEKVVAEFERGQSEDLVEGLVFGGAALLGDEPCPAVVIDHEGGHEDAAVIAQRCADESVFGGVAPMFFHDALGHDAAAESEGGDFPFFGRVEGSLGVLDEEERDGELPYLVEADDVDGLGDGGDFDTGRVVAEGVGGCDHLGGDDEIFANQRGELLDGGVERVGGELLDELDDFRKPCGFAGFEAGGDALDGLLSEGGAHGCLIGVNKRGFRMAAGYGWKKKRHCVAAVPWVGKDWRLDQIFERIFSLRVALGIMPTY